MNRNLFKKGIVFLVLVSLLGLTACMNSSGEEANLNNIEIMSGTFIEDEGSETLDFQLEEGDILNLKPIKEKSFSDLNNGSTYDFTFDNKDNLLIAFKEQTKADLPKPNNSTEEPVNVVSHVDLEGFNLVQSVEWDINKNGEEDKISLYTTAEIDSKGDIMLDDGQEWALIVSTDKGEFELFNDYIQIGSLDFYVFEIDQDFFITTVQSSTANLTITEYKYAGDSFVPSVDYNPTGNVNMIYSN